MDACFPDGINCNDKICQLINPGGYAVVGQPAPPHVVAAHVILLL